MDFTNKIKELLDKQNALEWQLIHLEQKETQITNELANPNVSAENKRLLLKALSALNEAIIKHEKFLSYNKREAELIGVLINKSDSERKHEPKNHNSFKMPFNQSAGSWFSLCVSA